MATKLFTSESVTEGHPDKICDQISDAVLDRILEQDPAARVACETCCTTGLVLIMGEITTDCYVEIPRIARDVICDIGYDRPELGFNGRSCSVITCLDEQSSDIAMGVLSAYEHRDGSADADDTIGAGDQGMMFGFACDETPEFMPMPISLSHALAKRLAFVRKSGLVPFLYPDGKTQVTVEYHDGAPARVHTVVVSSQHHESVSMGDLQDALYSHVILPTLSDRGLDDKTIIHINPTGRFVVGGPQGDSGLTGRKIIVDTYGGYSRHGGGAFSGKDPTKVDRSASYAARHIAKNIVAAGLARRCEIQISYAIGMAKPISVMVDTFGTGVLDDAALSTAVNKVFDLRPNAIIRSLALNRPIYRALAAYGHMGREELDVGWEKLDRVDDLIAATKLLR
jgi:S-adenosylmethionine synthetase